jgi:hypothetical protein
MDNKLQDLEVENKKNLGVDESTIVKVKHSTVVFSCTSTSASSEAKEAYDEMKKSSSMDVMVETVTEKEYPIKKTVEFAHAIECKFHFFLLCLMMQVLELWMFVIIGMYTVPLKKKVKLHPDMAGAYVFTSITCATKAIPWIQTTFNSFRHSIRVRRYSGIFICLVETTIIATFFYAYLTSTMAQANVAAVAANTCGMLAISQVGDGLYQVLGVKSRLNVGTEVRDANGKVTDYKAPDPSKEKGLVVLYRALFACLIIMMALTLNLLRYQFKISLTKGIPGSDDNWDDTADSTDSSSNSETSAQNMFW